MISPAVAEPLDAHDRLRQRPRDVLISGNAGKGAPYFRLASNEMIMWRNISELRDRASGVILRPPELPHRTRSTRPAVDAQSDVT